MIAGWRGSRLGIFFIIALLVAQATVGAAIAGAQVDGTASAGDQPTVITAQNEPLVAHPSGDQTLRLAGPTQGPETLDPVLARDLSTAFIVRQIYRGLVGFDADLHPVPELADRIEISPDGLTYTFHLRDGVTFQDGQPIRAPDVVFSLTRAMNPATTGGEAELLGGPTFLSDIDGAADILAGKTDKLRGVTALDQQNVQIRLSAPRATFLMKLAAVPASIVDPRDVEAGGNWWKTPNGSGPFNVKEWVPDDHLTLTRFDKYFSGPPPLKEIDIALGQNALQPFNLYQGGKIDVDSVSINALDRVMAPESALHDEVTVTPLFAVDYIAFRTDVAPMDDPMIRRAIQLAFPRDKVAHVTYEDYVSPAQGLIPKGMLDRDWPVDAPPHDLDAARNAIAKSRYGSADNVPPIQIYLAGGGAAESLRDSLKASLGLTIDVISVDWPEFVDGLSRRSYPAYELYWSADYPDPESFLRTLFGSDSADNYIGYHNPAFDKLLKEAAAAKSVNEQASFYAQANQALMDDSMVIPLYYDVAYTVMKPYVKGLQMTPLGIMRLETVWLEH
jgi:ABC-type transport system substrate-binding protein